jgi:hypothetical protein
MASKINTHGLRRTGLIVAVILWSVAIALLGVVSLEFSLRVRDRSRTRRRQEARMALAPKRTRLEQAYEPFTIAHLHPQYVFFFPLKPAERVSLSSDVCSLDAQGFRGPGPENSRGRQLAFLVGASTAFGYMASSDQQTISAQLNRLQQRYFFVNAGVPSWNSTQEMFRVAFELLDYHPALIVTLDGANDAALLQELNDESDTFPSAVPESFWKLQKAIDGERHESRIQELLPAISMRLVKEEGGVGPSIVSDSDIDRAAARYVRNQARIRDLGMAIGAQVLSTLQPVADLHRNLRPSKGDAGGVIDGFYRAVVSKAGTLQGFHDMSRIFDNDLEIVPIAVADIKDEDVFVDQVHLTDRGNELIARHLMTLLP